MEKIKKALEQAREQRFSYEKVVNDTGLKNANRQLVKKSGFAQKIPSFVPDPLVLENNRIINNSTRKEFVQPFKVLRTRLMHIAQEKGWSTIAVLSPTKDDGKTTVAINLALSIAKGLHHNALLLDLDLITPSVHSYFDYMPEYGLDDYFESDISLNQILVSPGIENLAIAPSVRPLHGSSEYLASDKSAALIAAAKKHNPDALILVDLPPILVSDDAIAISPFIDAVLLVIREGSTTKKDIQRSLELLSSMNIAGVVLNDSVEPTELGYY